MADDPNGRAKAARDAMKMTLEELATWRVARASNDTFRQSIVDAEYERRAAVSARKNARYTLWSVVAIVAAAVIAGALGHWWPFR